MFNSDLNVLFDGGRGIYSILFSALTVTLTLIIVQSLKLNNTQ